MNPLKKLLHLGGTQDQTTVDMRNNLIFRAGEREITMDTDDELKRKEDLGVRFLVTIDEDADAVLAMKCLNFQYIPRVDKDGNVLYERDENGEIRVDGKGQPIPQYVQTYSVNSTYAALQRMLSPVNRNVFLDPKNKRLMELKMQDIIETAKMAQNEEDFNLPESSYLDSLEATMMMLLNDAVNGNKVKAMLENRKVSTFDIMNPKEKKGVM